MPKRRAVSPLATTRFGSGRIAGRSISTKFPARASWAAPPLAAWSLRNTSRKGSLVMGRYTINSAKYANEEGTAIEIATEESGAVMVCDEPGQEQDWSDVQEWIAGGGTVAPWVKPEPEMSPPA